MMQMQKVDVVIVGGGMVGLGSPPPSRTEHTQGGRGGAAAGSPCWGRHRTTGSAP